MNIRANLALFFLIGIVLSTSCTSDPIIVEIPGGPIGDPTENDTLVLITETDLCVEPIISFEREILPLIVSSCAYSGCHDAISKEEGIILENYTGIIKEVKPGNPSNSELYKSITENPNDEDFMPPKPAIALSSSQVTLIKTWIEQGANNTDCNVPCDSENASFSQDVQPLINTHCLGCHQPSNALAGINLIDFEHIRSMALTGQLMGSIKHISGYDPMPKTALKMTDCQIATIQNWITEGVQNN